MSIQQNNRLDVARSAQSSSSELLTEGSRRSFSFRGQKQKPSSSSSPYLQTSNMDGKKSPNSSIRHRRSRDLHSSQESLPSPALQRPGSRASYHDISRDSEGVDSNHKEDGQESTNGSRSASPDKPHNTFERSSNRNSLSDGGDRNWNDGTLQAGSSLSSVMDSKKGGSTLDLDRKDSRERSFEKSLENTLARCSQEKTLDLSLPVDSLTNLSMDSSRSPGDVGASSTSSKASKSEKKKNRWYSSIMSTNYKSRSEDFKKMFKDVPRGERLIVDYSCALQKDILVQGRMYISQNWICFYAKIFNWETVLVIPCKDITAITKEKTARVIPNAIQITTEKEKFFFTSFGARDKTYYMLFRIWQTALMVQPMPLREVWTWIHYYYGDDLGLTSSDDDYEAPQTLEDININDKLKEDIPLNREPYETKDMNQNTCDDPVTTPSMDETGAMISADEVFTNSLSSTNPPLPNKQDMTDFLDSSEDSEGEFTCPGHDHLEKMYLDEVFSLNIDTIFQCLFTDSAFFRAFVSSRKTYDLHLPPWEDEPDDNGNSVRHISYTLTLNNSIGPKTSPSIEKQIQYKMSHPGRIYHVDCECCNGNIPYSESFYVLLRYCLTRVSSTKCRVVLTGELKYRKHVMGVFRNMIEKSAINGLTDYCRQLSVHLRREAERLEHIVVGHQNHGHQNQLQHSQQSGTIKKKVRRKRGKLHPSQSDNPVPIRQTDRQVSVPPSPSNSASKEEKLIELNAYTLVRIIIVILVLLLLFNAVLFYKLWSLESYASSLYGMPSQDMLDNLAKHPRTQEEWSQLLQQQKMLHEHEITKWEEVLSASIHIVDQMKNSLTSLQRTLRMGPETPET